MIPMNEFIKLKFEKMQNYILSTINLEKYSSNFENKKKVKEEMIIKIQELEIKEELYEEKEIKKLHELFYDQSIEISIYIIKYYIENKLDINNLIQKIFSIINLIQEMGPIQNNTINKFVEKRIGLNENIDKIIKESYNKLIFSNFDLKYIDLKCFFKGFFLNYLLKKKKKEMKIK
jgi:hypothetical protein